MIEANPHDRCPPSLVGGCGWMTDEEKGKLLFVLCDLDLSGSIGCGAAAQYALVCALAVLTASPRLRLLSASGGDLGRDGILGDGPLGYVSCLKKLSGYVEGMPFEALDAVGRMSGAMARFMDSPGPLAFDAMSRHGETVAEMFVYAATKGTPS